MNARSIFYSQSDIFAMIDRRGQLLFLIPLFNQSEQSETEPGPDVQFSLLNCRTQGNLPSIKLSRCCRHNILWRQGNKGTSQE